MFDAPIWNGNVTISRIAGHNFDRGFCTTCQRLLIDVLPYGAAGMAKIGDKGIACADGNVGLNDPELTSLREAWRRQQDNIAAANAGIGTNITTAGPDAPEPPCDDYYGMFM